jgi:RNA polymerase sigma-70 factor, ECF subfamily
MNDSIEERYVKPRLLPSPRAAVRKPSGHLRRSCHHGCLDGAHADVGTRRAGIRSAQRPVSFEEFFDAEGSRLFGALVLMGGNRAEAEEIVQDAFLKVWERWERVSRMESPAGFLYRTSLNLYRSRFRRAAVAIKKATHLLAQDDALGEVETRDEVARLLRALTPREREALVLTAYLGYSTEEAGRLLGIKANTVRVLTARARASLRRRTTQEEPR